MMATAIHTLRPPGEAGWRKLVRSEVPHLAVRCEPCLAQSLTGLSKSTAGGVMPERLQQSQELARLGRDTHAVAVMEELVQGGAGVVHQRLAQAWSAGKSLGHWRGPETGSPGEGTWTI